MATSPKPRLVKKATKKTVNVKIREPIYQHLEEFRETHSWSVNETILQAINLLVVIQQFDREDAAIASNGNSTPQRQTGRIFYEGRLGERKDFAGDLMLSMSTTARPSEG